MKDSNIIFWGTPESAVTVANTLHQNDFNIVAVITQQDKPVGRKKTITPPPMKVWALEHNIPVLQPSKLDADFMTELTALSPAVSIVVAYGKILPQSIIDLPEHGTLNIHYSLLPLYRGASPVEAAILNGDAQTGVSIQQMVFELDTGPIVAEQAISLSENETSPQIKEMLSEIGGELLSQTLPEYLSRNIEPRPQDASQASKCGLIKKSEGDITNDDNITRWRKYRAFQPWPGVFYFDQDGKRVKVTQARFENETFIIDKIIPEGQKERSL
jgi:methionyl-tRNA formyltransferase